MKNKIATLLLIVFAFSANTIFAQENEVQTEYLFDSKIFKSISGFGGPMVQFSKVNKEFAVCNGGGGAVLFNQTFFFGGYGMGLSTSHKYDISDSSIFKRRDKDELVFGHGGFWLGYINNHHKIIHWGASAKIGWGAISLYDPDFQIDDETNQAIDIINVITPMIECELNVTRWFKINAGLGYRLVNGIDTKYYKSSEFNSPVANLSLLFGNFVKKNKKETTKSNL